MDLQEIGMNIVRVIQFRRLRWAGHVVRMEEGRSAILKLNLWLTAPKGVTPINKTSATDWLMAVQRDNVISITLHQVYQCRFS